MLKYINMILVLSVITLLGGLALGGLNELTWELAENNILRFKKIPAVANIYEAMEGKLSPEKRAAVEETLLAGKMTVNLGEEEPTMLFVIKKDGRLKAVAFERFGQGFGGPLGVMIGYDQQNENLAGIGITTLSETPGLGSRVTEKTFTTQFRAMSLEKEFKVKKDGGDIDGVSGATISSRAVAQAAEQSRLFYDKHREKIQQILTR